MTPDFVGLPYRDVAIQSESDIQLHGWWLEAELPARGVVYFLHGNGGNISTNLNDVFWLAKRGYHVFMLDYRGYGFSTGAASVAGLVADVQAGWHWLIEQQVISGLPVYVIGQSLGASVAGSALAALESSVTPHAIVLDSGFASYASIARDAAARSWITWPLQWPVAWSMPDGYDLQDAVAVLARRPLLIMHSRDDRVVPFKNAKQLLLASGGRAKLYAYQGSHVGALMLEKHRLKLLDYFAEHDKPGR